MPFLPPNQQRQSTEGKKSQVKQQTKLKILPTVSQDVKKTSFINSNFLLIAQNRRLGP